MSVELDTETVVAIASFLLLSSISSSQEPGEIYYRERHDGAFEIDKRLVETEQES